MNIIEGLQEEMTRNREILKFYEEIPQGAFGAMMIKKDIADAEKAIAEGDTLAMIRVYESLKETN